MNQAQLKILFFGTPTFSVTALEALVADARFNICGIVTQPDKPAGRGQNLQTSPVKQFALANGIPVFQPSKLRGKENEFLESIKDLGSIDFGVVIAFGQILPSQILSYPKFGCINVHASLLPRWRGAAPIQRALLAGDKKTGICIMQMDVGLDTGAIYSFDSTPISEEETSSSLHETLATLGAKLLVETLLQVAYSSLKATPQPEHGITYAEKIGPQDLKIDWAQNVSSIKFQIQAFSPKPGAYTLLDNKRLKVLKAQPLSQTQENIAEIAAAEPGTIVSASENGLIVKTADALLNILELQLEGKKAMLVSDFVKGQTGLVGKVFGKEQE